MGVSRLVGLAILAALVATGGARGTSGRVAGTLQLSAQFSATSKNVACLPQAPEEAEVCMAVSGAAAIRGLGRATVAYTLFIIRPAPDSHCAHWADSSGTITVEDKGELDFSIRDPSPNTTCITPATTRAAFLATISGGSGTYTGASGTATIDGPPGDGVDELTGNLSVAGLEFDTTPPALRGGISKIVRMRPRATRARVSYRVTATDNVDSSVAVTCKPRSGSPFKIGRTTVRCSATDSSANTGRAQFTITVKRSKG